MNTQDFDRLLDSIRTEAVPEETVREACSRVRTRMEAELGESATVERLESCADFRGLFPAYRKQTLSEGRRMLVEDHLHSCVACRRAFQGSGRVVVIPNTAERSLGRRVIPWAMAAAAAVVLGVAMRPMLDRVLAPSGARATIASVQGEVYRVSDGGLSELAVGAPIGENDEIRTSKGSRAVVRLRDGSTMEMAERSDLRISERWSGKTVRLERGAVMVEAAKQRRGRLEIATVDCLVSVKGTIFEVSAGTKGSRVSVVEGEVKVDREGATDLLHRGDQRATNVSMATTSVAEDVAWSTNAAKYLALLGELSAIQKRIEAIPGPGLRYESKLAGLLPENTMVFAAIPNLGSTLSEASNIFEERVQQSAVLREWWNEKNSVQLRAIVDQVKTFSDYLGDEVVLAIPADAKEPLLIAEARRPGLQAFLEQQFSSMKAAGESHVPALIQNPQMTSLGQSRVAVMVHGNVIAVGSEGPVLARVAALADSGGKGGFLATPFWQGISQRYQSGAGWIFAADMEQILARHVPQMQNVTNPANISGLDNVRYLTIERKQNLGRTENSAALSFAGERRGLASWLAAPGPMGTLDFVSPDASFAGSFVLKNPGTLLQEIIALAGSKTGPAAVLSEFQKETGVNIVNDIAANLGGEMTVAVDGPLLPTPSWKVAIEVNNPAAIEGAIGQAVTAAQRDYPDAGLQLANSQVSGRTYYSLTSTKVAYEIDYVFTDGYLLMAPSQALLTASIQTRSSGITLERSTGFRAQLPQDGHVNFSALLYYNLGAQIGPVADQLKSSGIMTKEQQQSVAALTANREPGLIYAYGEPDRIVVASRSGFFGLGLDTLVGLNAKGAGALPQLLPSFLTGAAGHHTPKNAARN
jgi:hypothetical protein